ncbi:uncharacterized protein EV420DRAFT_1641597 [Desarmillaria tabescens]|uniref:Uncharacterized protein n=1 Tax=Armillaria tabescens TaxID=1929756 RepID=A0AA39KI11_ARMTA|nr:uncharacterized protein EV420DRAFT_1641597 [Desarmillaria tabescens]KAK0460254.1 hypothetical protein EV420DRAFT_1641597 [Desarmillaria tabescens]
MIRSHKGMRWIMEWSHLFLEVLFKDTLRNPGVSNDEFDFRSDAGDAYSETTAFVSSSFVALDHYIECSIPSVNAVREAPLADISYLLPTIVGYVNSYSRDATQPSPPNAYSSNVMPITNVRRSDDGYRKYLLEQNMLIRTCRALAEPTSPRIPVLQRTWSMYLLPPNSRVELIKVALRHRLLQSIVRATNLVDSFAPLTGFLEMVIEYRAERPMLARKARSEIVHGELDVREDSPLDPTLSPSNVLAEQRDKAWEAWGRMKEAIIGDRNILEKCMNPKCRTKPRKEIFEEVHAMLRAGGVLAGVS